MLDSLSPVVACCRVYRSALLLFQLSISAPTSGWWCHPLFLFRKVPLCFSVPLQLFFTSLFLALCAVGIKTEEATWLSCDLLAGPVSGCLFGTASPPLHSLCGGPFGCLCSFCLRAFKCRDRVWRFISYTVSPVKALLLKNMAPAPGDFFVFNFFLYIWEYRTYTQRNTTL